MLPGRNESSFHMLPGRIDGEGDREGTDAERRARIHRMKRRTRIGDPQRSFQHRYRRQHQCRQQRRRRSSGRAAAECGAEGDALRQVEPLPCAERTRSGVTNEGGKRFRDRNRKEAAAASRRTIVPRRLSILGAGRVPRRNPARERRDGQSAMRCTGMPSWVALSRRFSEMPEPGNPMTPLGRSFSS